MAGKGYDPLAPGISPLTPAQQAYVNAQTHNAVAPERAAMMAAQRSAQREALAQQQRIMGFAQAAAAQLSQGVDQTKDAYHQAVTDQQGLASGFSQQMQARLAGVPGAPAGAADATYNLGGVIPGTRLNADALAQGALAASQPDTQLKLGQVGLRGSAFQAQQQNKGFLDQLTTLAAKEPALRAQIIDALQKNEISKSAARTQRDYLLNTQTKTSADITGTYTDKNGVVHPTQQAQYDQGRVAAAKARVKATQVKNQKVSAQKRDKAVATARQDMTTYGRKTFFETYRGPDYYATGALSTRPKVTRAQARNDLFVQYGQDILQQFSSAGAGRRKLRAQIFQVIDQTLNLLGFPSPAMGKQAGKQVSDAAKKVGGAFAP